MNWRDRIKHYHEATGFPESMFIAGNGECVGMWVMGNDYRVKSQYYGGYPAGYLRRVKALFPDKKNVLHLFSGKVDTSIMPGKTVDINPDLNPCYVVDLSKEHQLYRIPVQDFDLIMADPPYSVEDCEHYGTAMVNRNMVVSGMAKAAEPGTHLVWLDQVLPMHRKDEWAVDARIGMVKSTNHRFRVVTIFRKL